MKDCPVTAFKKKMDGIEKSAKVQGWRTKREVAAYVQGWCFGFADAMYEKPNKKRVKK